MRLYKVIAGVATFGVDLTAKKLSILPGEVRKILKDGGLSRSRDGGWEKSCEVYIRNNLALSEINLNKWVANRTPVEEEIEI